MYCRHLLDEMHDGRPERTRNADIVRAGVDMLDDGTTIFEAELCAACATEHGIENGHRFGGEEAEHLDAAGRLPSTFPCCTGCIDDWLARPERSASVLR